MSDIILSGQITAVMPLQQGMSQKTGQPWMSQYYLLMYEGGQYPKSICFKVFGQDKIQQFAIQQGEQLTVHLNITARQGTNGYFNDVDCWKVERVGQAMPQGQPMAQPVYQQPMMQQPIMQAQPMMQQAPAPFPPQVNHQGQPMMQPQGGSLPFPPAQ